MKKKRLGLVIGILAVLAAGITFFVFFKRKKNDAIKIETVVATTGDISSIITATGTIQPTKQVAIGTQVSGVVQKIYVDFNSRVKAGQLIAELDKTNLYASLELAEANYNAALNEQAYLQKIYDKQAALYQNKMISELDYETALYNWNSSKATVQQRKSDVVKARTNLGYANIYAPIDGVVLSKAVDAGQTVAASFNTPTLFTIAQDLTQMQVEANVDEADIGNVKVGQRVTFTVDAYPNMEFAGKVSQIRLNATVTSNVVTYVVIVKAKNPDLKLVPGLTATISIYTMELKEVLTLEAKALNFRPDRELMMQYRLQQKDNAAGNEEVENKEGEKKDDWKKKRGNRGARAVNDSVKVVWVLQNSLPKRTKIKTGASDGISVQVISGLKDGDSVLYSMSSGDAVQAPGGSANSGSPFMPKMPNRGRRRN